MLYSRHGCKSVTLHLQISLVEQNIFSITAIYFFDSGVVGSKMLPAVYFTISRGALVNDGSSIRIINATFYWGPVSMSFIVLCL